MDDLELLTNWLIGKNFKFSKSLKVRGGDRREGQKFKPHVVSALA